MLGVHVNFKLIKLYECSYELYGDSLKKQLMRELFGRNTDDFEILSKDPVMINSDFASNYEIKRYELDSLIRDKYKVMSSFEPCTHPAVIIKYYYNSSYDVNNGKCCCPKQYGNKHLCNGRGNGTKDGGCKTVTILVFQSGKVILTGGRHLDQVNSGFEFIQNVLGFEFIQNVLDNIINKQELNRMNN